MTDSPRTTDFLLTKEQKKTCIDALIVFFRQERDETIGIIAAGAVLDFVLRIAGEDIYRKGVKDADAIVKQNIANLEVDLNVLLN